MKKIEKDESISQLISFSKVVWQGCVSFWLVFSSELSISKAVAASYVAASEDKLKDTAAFLREVILNAFKNSKEMHWPPSVDDMRRWLLKSYQKNSKDFSILFSVEMNQAQKNVSGQNVSFTLSVKMCAVLFPKDDGNLASIFLCVLP